MKENNNTLRYTLKGEISEINEQTGRVTVVKGKNTDDLVISDMIDDIVAKFGEWSEGDEVDVLVQMKKITK